MNLKSIVRLSFSIILTITVSFITYMAFVNYYSSSTLNYNNFIDMYSSGVYQFRFLSRDGVSFLYQYLNLYNINYDLFKFKFYNSQVEPQYFLTIFLYNTFFSILTIVILNIILNSKNFDYQDSEKSTIITIITLFIGITQYVIVPYDTFGYFVLMLFFYLLLKYLSSHNKLLWLFLMGFTVLIGTFNRESSALMLALSATLLMEKYGINKNSIYPVICLTLSFLCAYFGVRFFYGSHQVNNEFLLFINFKLPKNLILMCLWIWMIYFPFSQKKTKSQNRLLIYFLIWSIPYLISSLIFGVFYEVRLYLPIFLVSLLLARTSLIEKVTKDNIVLN